MVWVAKFRLRDDEDIYTPLCEDLKVDFFAVPYNHFVKNGKINLLLGGIISGSVENKEQFISELKKRKQIKRLERNHDFIILHVEHPLSREYEAEIKIFYNPQYIMVKPVHVSSDGWEYWEVASFDRSELNKIIKAAIKYYHGELFYVKNERLKSISSMTLTPFLTEKQLGAIRLAYKEGYYDYPRKITISQLSKIINRSYSTFQENLRRAESKIVDFFLKYR